MNKFRKLCLMTFVVLLTTGSINTRAQAPAGKKKQQPRPDAAATPVAGSGTSGQISKWIGFNGSSSVIGDSNITEDKFGSIGIGTTAPTSVLTVRGMIETTLGGYKFPDGTIQTTAGISLVTHDASLAGFGNAASPLGIAPGGVNTIHLANGVVTAPKIANGTVVRSFNGLFDNVLLTAGSNITITPAGNTLTIASPNSLTSVFHDSTLTGAGSSGSPLGVANGGIGTAQLANNGVTLSKIAPNQVVTSLNNLTDNVMLAAGPNITITPSGNMLTIAGAVEGAQGFISRGGVVQPLDIGLIVVSKTVPAGSYLINFTVTLFNNDGDSQITTCTLSTGDSAFLRLPPISTGTDGASLTLQDAATFNGQTTITVTCGGFKGQARRSVLTALRVDSIQ